MGLIQKRMSKTGVVGEIFPTLSAYELCCGATAQSRCDYDTFAIFTPDTIGGTVVTSLFVRVDGAVEEIYLDSPVYVKNSEALLSALAEIVTELGYFGQFSLEIQDGATTPTVVLSAKSELELIGIKMNGADVYGFAKNCPNGIDIAVNAFNDTVGATAGNETKAADKPYVKGVLMLLYDVNTGLEISRGLTSGDGKAIFKGILDGDYYVAFNSTYEDGAPFSPPADSPKNISVVNGVVIFNTTAPNAWVDAPNYPLS